MNKRYSINKKTPSVIYIASVSRSGSTLFDMTLGSLHEFCSVGEMRQLQGYAVNSHDVCNFSDDNYPLICTCGEFIDKCEFWSKVESDSGLDFRSCKFKSDSTRMYRRLVQIIYIVAGSVGVKIASYIVPKINDEISIAKNCNKVYESISRLTNCLYVVDSSKSIYHYILLKIALKNNVKLVVIHRDGRAVSKALIKGARINVWQRFGQDAFSQAVRYWRKTNKLITLFSCRTSSCNKLTLRYEDFCSQPQKTISLLFSQFKINSSPLLENSISEKKTMHNIGGSPGRFDINRTQIKCDDKWKHEITDDEKSIFESIAGKYNRSLKYD